VPPEPALPRQPYLILEGNRQFDLVKRVVRMGRARDGDVVIDDRRVSRNHCELRWEADTQRFLLVDLNSTGGTQVNGYPVLQCPLEAGDIMSLGGLEIIYGEAVALSVDNPPLHGTTDSVARTP
jgi:pSer/pThr/pTyr-binding forkhead associated (FHA) protein